MRTLIAACAAFLLAACATTPCTPMTVSVPVVVSCVEQTPTRPAWAVGGLGESASDFEKIQALAVDYLLQRQYINNLEAVIEGCR